jgi:glycosyltransferase involved in cell wall biosynthesis
VRADDRLLERAPAAVVPGATVGTPGSHAEPGGLGPSTLPGQLVDGIERQRAKWGLAGRIWYTLGERFALVFPNAIVSDAHVIDDYYRERYGKASTLIAYGAPLLERDPPPDLTDNGLGDVQPGRYILYVSRLEPENQADLVIRAYRDVPGDVPLLIVGDAPYASAYKERLRELAAADSSRHNTGPGVPGLIRASREP